MISVVLAEPIVRLLYERGAFDPDETHVVAGALAAFSIGLTFNGMMLMLNRGFFSLQAPWIPTVVALANLALNVVLYAVFYRVGAWGIPLAISLANIAGVALLLVALRRRHRPDRPGVDDALVRCSSRSPRRCSRAVVLRRLVRCSTTRSAARSRAQLVSLGTALVVGGDRLPRSPAARSGCPRWRRYSPCETASAGA